MLQQKFTVQVTTLPYCDDITRFDGTCHIFSFYYALAISLAYRSGNGGGFFLLISDDYYLPSGSGIAR
jgi:hypothetical protein